MKTFVNSDGKNKINQAYKVEGEINKKQCYVITDTKTNQTKSESGAPYEASNSVITKHYFGRKWMGKKSKGKSLLVMSYNAETQHYIDQNFIKDKQENSKFDKQYRYKPNDERAFDYNYRLKKLINLINFYNPDVLCIQEATSSTSLSGMKLSLHIDLNALNLT